MNFAKIYPGDYLADTGTLTVTQHGAYLLMLMHFYATEKPLPRGRELHRLLRAETRADRDAIDVVAARFWTWHEASAGGPDGSGGLLNARAQREIERASAQRDINREIGKRGGRPRGSGSAAAPEPKPVHAGTEYETESVPSSEPNRNPNQTPDTRHQTEHPGNSPLSSAPPAGAREAAAPAVVDMTPHVAAAKALIAGGIPSMHVSASHPTLRALVDAGATVDEFADAARDAMRRQVRDPCRYAMAAMVGRRNDAERSARGMARGPLPIAAAARPRNRQQDVEEENQRVVTAWLSQRNGATA